VGRKRQDRTVEEWTVYGENLLNIISKKHKLYKNIEKTISKLISETKNKTKQELTNQLNLYKDDLGKHWLKWTKKIKQKPKDENRSKFYIENNTYNKILSFTELTKETKKQRNISDNDVFNRIFKLLHSLGIHNESEMKLILAELEKFKSGISERNSKDKLTDKNVGYQGKTSKIIHAILKELGDKQISSFEKLQSIKKHVRNKEINKLEGEIESLKNKIKILESKLGDDEIELEFDK
jgi:polyhydroxyalkanoate synthesis regulator phasin